MKSGMTLALLLGAIIGIAGAVFKSLHWQGANGMLIAGLFVAVIAFAFLMLQNAQKQAD
jgi:ABC-type enterobactin transport system permease subunit